MKLLVCALFLCASFHYYKTDSWNYISSFKKKNCLKDFKDKIIFNSSNVIYDQVIQMGFGPHVVKILLDGC